VTRRGWRLEAYFWICNNNNALPFGPTYPSGPTGHAKPIRQARPTTLGTT